MAFERTPGVTLEKIQSGNVPRPRARSEETTQEGRKRRHRDDKKPEKRKKQRKDEELEEGLTPEKGTLVPTQLPERSSVLGIVARISRDAVIVDLLCGLTGFVRIEQQEADRFHVGDYLCATVCRPTVERRKSERRMIQLSLSPKDFNSGFSWSRPPLRNQIVLLSITSIEDHGLGASFNTTMSSQDGVKTYVPFPKNKSGKDYAVGQTIMAVVDEIKKGSKLIVCKTGEDMISRYLGFSSAVDVSTLKAGQLIECKVKSVIQHQSSKSSAVVPKPKKTSSTQKCFPASGVIGVEFAICQTLKASASRDHLHNPILLTDKPRYPFLQRKIESARLQKIVTSWPKRCARFETDDACLARIAAVIEKPQEKQILVSLLDHNVWLTCPRRLIVQFSQLRMGEMRQNLRVMETNEKTGVKFLVPINDVEDKNVEESEITDESFRNWKFNFDSCLLAWCPKPRVSEETPEFKISQLNPGQKIEAKVFGTNMFDARVITYMSEKYLKEPLCVPEDVVVGSKVKAEVVEKKGWGLAVRLSDFLVAKASNNMLSDMPSDKISSQFKVGSKGKFRVLSVDLNSGTIHLTCKKSLVDISEEELNLQRTSMEAFNEEHINKIFHTFVKCAHEKGLVLCGFGQFFGSLSFDDIRAYLEQPGASDDEILNSKKFREGTSLRVRLSQIIRNGSRTRFRFSLDLDKRDVLEVTEIGPTGNDVSKESWDAEHIPLEKRLKSSCSLPFEYSTSEDPTDVAKRALEFFPLGSELIGKVVYKSEPAQVLNVAIFGPLRVWVHSTELQNKMKGFPLEGYRHGDQVSVTIRGMLPSRYLSLSPLILLEGSMRCDDEEPLPKTVNDLDMNKTYSGVIQRLDKNGLFVYLSSTLITRVQFRHLWQKNRDLTAFLKDHTELSTIFPSGKVVRKLRIIAVSLSKGTCEASLKPKGPRIPTATVAFENIEVGSHLAAKVKRIESFGIFVTLENSNNLDCLCPNSEIHDAGPSQSSLEPGDLVLVKILDKDTAKRRIKVGMKASYFEGVTFDDEVEDAGHSTQVSEAALKDYPPSSSSSTISSDTETHDTASDNEEENSVDGSIEDESGDKNEFQEMNDRVDTSGLKVNLDLEPDMEDVEDPLKMLLRKSCTQSEDVAPDSATPEENVDELEMEQKVRDAERANAEQKWKTSPTSIDDFERLILVQGDDSYVWIAYMGYFAKLSDFESARKIAQRGVQSMTFEQPEQRSNIWIAWLNLEAHFGTLESLRSVYNQALQYNEPSRIFNHMIDVYEAKREWKELDEVLNQMLKKSGDKLKTWLRVMSCLYSRDSKNQPAVALTPKTPRTLTTRAQIDNIAQRAISRLPTQMHVEFNSVIARLEFKYVSSESGRSKFQNILTAYPKRLDIWNVLLDAQMSLLAAERNDKEITMTRELFRQATSINFNPHKMKTLFKRWLEFETKYGTASTFRDIQKKAQEYVALRQLA